MAAQSFCRHYKDALHDKDVKSFLLSAAIKCKKGAKAQDGARNAVEEFELLVATVVGDAEVVLQQEGRERYVYCFLLCEFI